MRAESEVLEVKVPLICPSTVGVPALREGRYLYFLSLKLEIRLAYTRVPLFEVLRICKTIGTSQVKLKLAMSSKMSPALICN
jgi:hypothetical protein